MYAFFMFKKCKQLVAFPGASTDLSDVFQYRLIFALLTSIGQEITNNHHYQVITAALESVKRFPTDWAKAKGITNKVMEFIALDANLSPLTS